MLAGRIILATGSKNAEELGAALELEVSAY